MKILLFGIDKKYAQEKFKLKSLSTDKNTFMNKNKDIYYITDNEGDLIGQGFDIIIDYRPIDLLPRLNKINLQNYRIADNWFICEKQTFELEQELAELKEKAIVPRFKFDEECVVIMFGSYHFHRFIAQVKDDLCLTQPYNDTEEWYYVKPEMVFKTLEEAQAKLKEIQGNE